MLDNKKLVKNSQNLNAFFENQIHRVNSPYNDDSKTIILLANFREGRTENLGKMAKNRETYCYAN